MLTHWAASLLPGVDIERKSSLIALLQASIFVAEEQFDWPSRAEVAKVQIRHMNKVPDKVKKVDGLWEVKEAAWIPESESELKMKIAIAGQFGLAGHRGVETTLLAIQKHFY